MPAEIEVQAVLEKAKEGIKSLLYRGWNRLLWHPELQIGGQTIKGVVIPSESLIDTDDHSRGITRTLYATPLGEIHSVVFDKINPPPNGTMYGEVSNKYYALLGEGAVERLAKLPDEQRKFLEKDPVGREIFWKFRESLFDRTLFSGLEGFQGAKVWVRQGRFYCPEHNDRELKEYQYSDNPRGNELFSGKMLSCPIDLAHCVIRLGN